MTRLGEPCPWDVLGPVGGRERAPHKPLPPKKISTLDYVDVLDHISTIALIAQLDRATLYESVGCTFKSC